MDWYNNSSKRSSITTGQPTYPSPAFHGTIMTNNNLSASASLSNNPNTNTYQSSLYGSQKLIFINNWLNNNLINNIYNNSNCLLINKLLPLDYLDNQQFLVEI